MRVHEIERAVCTSAVVVALVFSALAAYSVMPRTVVVKRTAAGFTPSTVLIRKHDTVRFVNDTSKPLWIESDRYVSALIYPDANMTEPVVPGSSWSFTFNEAGVWAFHDADKRTYKGEVLVNGVAGEASSNCLRKAGPSLSAYCWEPEIRAIIQKQGLEAAFNFFAKEYSADDVFKGNCHDITHVLGAAAYEDFKGGTSVVNRQETSYCGYGFYHGFIQVALDGEGSDGLRAVRTYCETLEESDKFNSKGAAHLAASACYHGIGHAVFDLADESYWGDSARMVARALSTCESTLSDEHARYMCSTGVFNSLANALSARTFGLSFADKDIFLVCQNAKTEYQDHCYGELGLGYVREYRLSTKDSIEFFRTFGNASGTAASIGGIIDDDIRRGISAFDPEAYRKLCAAFKEQQYSDACLFGVSVGLSFGAQVSQDYSHMVGFCEGIPPGDSRRSCFEQMFARIRGIASEREMPAICAKLKVADMSAATCPATEE